MKHFKNSILIAALLLLFQSCYYDNEEELYGLVQSDCDTANVTYSNQVSEIMLDNCNACHNSNLPQGGVVTDNYEGIKQSIENDRLWGAVNHELGFSPMPKNTDQLSECDLDKIRIWIENGAQND